MVREDILININIRWLKFYKEEESGRRKSIYISHGMNEVCVQATF